MLELHREAATSQASRALYAEYMALIAERLGPAFVPSEAIFATVDAFRGPGTAWLVGYADGRGVCCGGMRPLEPGVAELKRMFVSAPWRRRGLGRRMLRELEGLAAAAGCGRVRLFTTEALTEARALYASAGYGVVEVVDAGARRDLWLEKALVSAR